MNLRFVLATAHEIANGFSVLAQDSFSCDLWFVLYTLKCRSTTGLWLSSQRAQWSNIAYCNIYLNEFLFSLALTPPITDWARVVNYSFYKIYNKYSARITNDSWVVRLLMKIFIATNATDSTIFLSNIQNRWCVWYLKLVDLPQVKRFGGNLINFLAQTPCLAIYKT